MEVKYFWAVIIVWPIYQQDVWWLSDELTTQNNDNKPTMMMMMTCLNKDFFLVYTIKW